MSGDFHNPGDVPPPTIPPALKRPWWVQDCPKCGALTECETVDNGVGLVQCTPFHCMDCGWTEGDDDPTAGADSILKPFEGGDDDF